MSPIIRAITWLLVLGPITWCPLALGRPRKKISFLQLPKCELRSACGYVQFNANGPNAQPICACQDGIVCPLEWDPLDGHTVVHGNDQYKFCYIVHPLPWCTTREPAFTSYTEISLTSMETLVSSVRVYCVCPANYLLLKNDSTFAEFENAVAISTSYLCKPAPFCEAESTCAAVTNNPSDGTSFVTRHCACPEGSFCPAHPRLATNRVDLDKGSYFVMQCI